MLAQLKDFTVARHIQYVTCTGEPVAWRICLGGLETTQGKRFTDEREAMQYAKDQLYSGKQVLVRYEYK